MKIALVNPGAMGASVGRTATLAGHQVLWLGRGRSEATRQRAEQAGLVAVDSAADLYGPAELLLSICPPAEADEVAERAITAGFKGLYCEANAISPERMRRLAKRLSAAGIQCVDGGIIGGPVSDTSGTCLYLSGAKAGRVAACFAGSPLETAVVDGRIGAASALKMTFAAYTKGSMALLAGILAAAEAAGVRAPLERRWGEKFTQQAHLSLCGNAGKAWRFVGEMEEIAATFAAGGQPAGFHLAAAEVFRRLADFKDAPAPDISQLLAALGKS